MNKEEHKQRFLLTLLMSFFVFTIITVSVAFSILIVYILLKTGAINSVGGRYRFGDIVILIFLNTIVISFLITMFTSKITLNPFNRLINCLNLLSKGKFKVRLTFGKPISLHPAFKEIENSFNRAAEELEHTEMLNSDFVNNFSHEFKTPIVSIAGFANLLRYGNLSEEETQEYLQVIEEESMRLSYMTTNVFNLIKVENQTILTGATKYNLSEQLRSAVLLLEEKLQQKELKLDIDFGEHFISANEELLKQVWINLLDNAIKFSHIGGTVSVKISECKNEVYVAVTNQGKDIPKESLSRIFNKFYQADESHSS